MIFTVLKTVIPREEVGVLVAFGNVNEAAGTFEPRNVGATPEISVQQVSDAGKPVQSVITQSTEPSISVPEKKTDNAQNQEEVRRIAEERRRQQEENQRRQNISNQVAGAFGNGTVSGSRGTSSSGTGIQGSPQGNADHGANSGVGGYGEFSLEGRSLGTGGLPRPAYSVQEEGRIVVNITVNPQGDVIFAEIGRGTNIDNLTMRNSALEAARKAKFNTISGTNNQSGTITYRYSFK